MSEALRRAAAPTFALMALVTGLSGTEGMCGGASPMTGMAPMYLLMALFHTAPWLNRAA